MYRLPNAIDFEVTLQVSNEALQRVRLDFNPDQVAQIDRIKLLSAALLTEVMVGMHKREFPIAKGIDVDKAVACIRESNIALTKIEDACMWAVKAATAK